MMSLRLETPQEILTGKVVPERKQCSVVVIRNVWFRLNEKTIAIDVAISAPGDVEPSRRETVLLPIEAIDTKRLKGVLRDIYAGIATQPGYTGTIEGGE